MTFHKLRAGKRLYILPCRPVWWMRPSSTAGQRTSSRNGLGACRNLSAPPSRPWKTEPVCTTYLLDTDFAIELLRGRNVRIVEQLASRNRNAIFLSTVTVAELMFGALRSRKPQESIEDWATIP